MSSPWRAATAVLGAGFGLGLLASTAQPEMTAFSALTGSALVAMCGFGGWWLGVAVEMAGDRADE